MNARTQQLRLFDPEPESSGTFSSLVNAMAFSLGPGWPDHFGTTLRQWAIEMLGRPLRTLSLFSGGGGLDIGFHDAGFDAQVMIEIDERFVATLKKNSEAEKYFEATEIVCDDIRNYTPKPGLQVDFVIGGPPCQTFSAAGRRAAGVQGTDDERGMLFEEYVRILRKLSPKGFLFENVYGITGAQNGEAWQAICQAFSDAGYTVFHRILDAADYGVPQHRERLFIVGTKGQDYFFPWPTHGPDSPGHHSYYSAGEAIDGVPITDEERSATVSGRYGHLLKEIPPGLNYSFYTEKMGHPTPVFAWRSKFSDFLYKADPCRPVRTIKAQGGQYTGPFHWENRPFGVGELKRLQTIPDSYQIVGGRGVAIHQIGNSVPPQLARMLALSILSQLFLIEFPFPFPLLSQEQKLGFRKRKRQLTESYQKKARAAVAVIKDAHTNGVARKRSYAAVLDENFGWTEKPTTTTDHTLLVDFVPSQQKWQFCVSHKKEFQTHSFEIAITPALGMEWSLGTEQVVLVGTDLTPTLFTGAWKAFESELEQLRIKADLVQLCGYYQYEPAIRGHMAFGNESLADKLWLTVAKVVSGLGVRAILSSAQLSEIWDISLPKVLEQALFLRTLGYEVRNRNTNPQIPDKHFLIPYCFPTLTPLSVQLRKSLEAYYE